MLKIQSVYMKFKAHFFEFTILIVIRDLCCKMAAQVYLLSYKEDKQPSRMELGASFAFSTTDGEQGKFGIAFGVSWVHPLWRHAGTLANKSSCTLRVIGYLIREKDLKVNLLSSRSPRE